MSEIQCGRCEALGHFAWECSVKSPDAEAAYAAVARHYKDLAAARQDNADLREALRQEREVREDWESKYHEANGERMVLRMQLDDAKASCNGLGCGNCESCVQMERAAHEVTRREAAEWEERSAANMDWARAWKRAAKTWNGYWCSMQSERDYARRERDETQTALERATHWQEQWLERAKKAEAKRGAAIARAEKAEAELELLRGSYNSLQTMKRSITSEWNALRQRCERLEAFTQKVHDVPPIGVEEIRLMQEEARALLSKREGLKELTRPTEEFGGYEKERNGDE